MISYFDVFLQLDEELLCLRSILPSALADMHIAMVCRRRQRAASEANHRKHQTAGWGCLRLCLHAWFTPFLSSSLSSWPFISMLWSPCPFILFISNPLWILHWPNTGHATQSTRGASDRSSRRWVKCKGKRDHVVRDPAMDERICRQHHHDNVIHVTIPCSYSRRERQCRIASTSAISSSSSRSNSVFDLFVHSQATGQIRVCDGACSTLEDINVVPALAVLTYILISWTCAALTIRMIAMILVRRHHLRLPHNTND